MDSDDEDYEVFSVKKDGTGDVIDRAINVAIKRDNTVEDYYGPWSVKWSMLCAPNGAPIASAEAKDDVDAITGLLQTHLRQRGINAMRLVDDSSGSDRSTFVHCALVSSTQRSERRNESVLFRDVFSTVSVSPIAAVVDLASQMDEAYKTQWKTMRNGSFGLTVLATYVGRKRRRNEKATPGPDVMKYTLSVLRGPETPNSAKAVEDRRKRLRLERDIAETVDEAVKAADAEKQ